MPATLYVGAVVPPPGQDSPSSPPLPGVGPSVNIPADLDANNVATMFTQQYETLADHVAALAKAAQFRAPLTAGSINGFTPVVHVGAGAGTILPVAPSPTVAQKTGGPRSVVIKIVTAGTQFQWSNDGGATYAAAANIAGGGNYTEPTSGITVNLTTPFANGDTYAFQTTDTPLAIWAGGDGKQRLLIDHLGFPGGRLCDIQENWDVAFSIAASTARAVIAAAPRWNAATSANATIARQAASLLPFYSNVKLTPGTANTNDCQLDAEQCMSGGFTGLVARLEFEFMMSVIGANLITWNVGLSNNNGGAGAPGTASGAYFFKGSGNTNWQWQTADGVAGALTGDTGIPPVANTMQRFRIEFYAAGTPAGRMVRFFINDQLVAQPVPAADYGVTAMFFSGVCTGAAASFGVLGPPRLTFGRFLDAPPL